MKNIGYHLLYEREALFQIPHGSLFRIFFNPNLTFHEVYRFFKEQKF